MMKNKELAKIFFEISDYLKMEKIAHKPFAYHRAALVLSSMEKDVADVYKEGGLKELEKIPGVGKSIAEKIVEYLLTGKIAYYEEFKDRIPVDLGRITAIEGMGPSRARILYEKLGIKDIVTLEEAVKQHKIAPLFGFGEKTEKNILEGIEFLKMGKGRFLLGEVARIIEPICRKLSEIKGVQKVSVAGSYRRKKETIGDADLLVIAKDPEKVMNYFSKMKNVVKVWGKGMTKTSVRIIEGFDIDMRIVPAKSYGAAWQYFTGSKEHNIMLRRIAMEKGYKLSEYGLFNGEKAIAGETEEGIYEKLGLPWVSPEIRENQGEIEAALADTLPKLVELKNIKGDLHCHTNWDGGKNTISEMAEQAMEMGYQYIGIADHTDFLKIERGLTAAQLMDQSKEIEKLNQEFKKQNKNFRIFHGCEANIMVDGSCDIDDGTLAKLDFVIAGVHSQMKMSRQEMTYRVEKTMRNPNIDIISHPTGRILQKRDEFQIDFERILDVAKETGTVLEINAYPDRLDLRDSNIRKAKEQGVKMCVNTDSHNRQHMRFMELGVSQARRGWAEANDIINTFSLEKFLKVIK